MEELLQGLVPGLPAEVREQILERAEGVPLYAVETVRMLLDRGLLVQEGAVYSPVGEIGSLEVPETLHALIAARLDGLSADERRLLQDGAVLGKTFAPAGLAAVGGRPAEELAPLLAGLVRKEVLGVQADPRSPEHGQYGFLQDLVRHVAYETLSKRERRARHLAAAGFLEATSAVEESEVVEVIASHYLDAYNAVPDADDADATKGKAYETLVRAGVRAVSLGAASEARRYFESSAALTDDARDQADLLARAGDMAGRTGHPEAAREIYERAIAIYDALGDIHAAARIWGWWATALGFTGHRDVALERLEQAYDVLVRDEPGEDVAVIAARLSRAYWFLGDQERAAERAEFALEIAEKQDLPAALAISLRAKGAVLLTRGHRNEADALLKQALEVALAHDLLEDASTCYFILSDRCFREDRYADALHYLDEALAIATRLGSRPYQWSTEAERAYALLMLGRWDEALATTDSYTEEQVRSGGVILSVLQAGVEGHCLRGELDAARRISEMYSYLESSTDMQDQGCVRSTTATLRRAEGRLQEALEAGAATIEVATSMGATFQGIKHGVVDAIDVALELGDTARAEELLSWVDELSPAEKAPWYQVQSLRFRARMAGDAAGLADAAARFRALSLPFWSAVAQLEQAEALGRDAAAEPVLAEARATFERLGAIPWLERAGGAVETSVAV